MCKSSAPKSILDRFAFYRAKDEVAVCCRKSARFVHHVAVRMFVLSFIVAGLGTIAPVVLSVYRILGSLVVTQ